MTAEVMRMRMQKIVVYWPDLPWVRFVACVKTRRLFVNAAARAGCNVIVVEMVK